MIFQNFNEIILDSISTLNFEIASPYIQLIVVVVIGSLQIWQSSNSSKLQKKLSKQQNQLTSNIEEKNDYQTSINFLSSSSPSVRIEGVKNLYNFAVIYREDKKQLLKIWKILNDHVKYYTQNSMYQESFSEKPSGDVEEIINIQASLDQDNGYPFKSRGKFIIDWSGAYLRGADLRGLNLGGAILDSVQFQNTELATSILYCASLKNAHLEGASIFMVHFQGANLMDVNMQCTNLAMVDLQGTNLLGANIQCAKIRKTNLHGAYMIHANLQGSYLKDINLQGACLENVQLQGAVFSNINMSGVYSSETTREKFDNSIYEEDSGYITFNRFKVPINKQIGINADLTNVIFAKGINEFSYKFIKDSMNLNEKFWNLTEGLKFKKKKLKKLLKDLYANHISEEVISGKDLRTQFFEMWEIDISSYSKVDAMQWIEAHERAIRSVPFLGKRDFY